MGILGLDLTPMLDSLVAALKSTSLSSFMTNSPWAWPICETLHFIGLSMVIGIVGLLDIRLMGFLRRIPISALRAMVPWGIAGFVINALTGALFFIGAPDQYVGNSAWWYKVAFLGVAGLNALVFETTQGAKVFLLAPHDAPPLAFRAAGAVSLLSWFMVLYWGRMLPFIGNAF
jgi:hypothetical protein